MRRLPTPGAWGILLGLTLLGSLAPQAAAATFTVSSAADAVDANPGNGICETAPGNGVCTLRAAIQEANALAGAHTIVLPAGTYTLTIPGANEDLAATGDLDLTGSLTISGAGAAGTIIDGGGLDRVFDILGGTVQISGVTIRNGSATTGPNLNFLGGGIHNFGTLSVDNTTVSANTAAELLFTNAEGGGIRNRGSATITNSAITGNVARGGGGISNTRLGPLANNGGPTRTHALLPGSPAIDSGDAAGCPATDSRGVARPQDGDGNGGAQCDIGAYEVRGGAPRLAAAVLPASRSVQVPASATVFATIINQGPGTAVGCRLAPVQGLLAVFGFQTTDPVTNQATGTPNTPASISSGAAQSFVFSLTPGAAIPPTDVELTFFCENADPAPIIPGLDTLLFSASTTPVPDIVALAATLNNDGIVTVPDPASGAPMAGMFAVATVNLGAGGAITVSADTGSTSLPISISLCQTDAPSGACAAAIGPTVSAQIDANATPSFGAFISASGPVPFDPAHNRIVVRFKDAGGVTRGATSVAVRTQQ